MHNLIFTSLVLALLTGTAPAHAAPPPPVLHELARTVRPWGTDPALVAAVKRRNADNADLAAIRRIDARWSRARGIDQFMYALMRNDAAKRLQQLERSEPYFSETFLMDARGAIVAMTEKTSDYWQGDERKFTDSYRNGQGGIHIGKVRYDQSAQTYLAQISVPVIAGGKAIGVLTVGVNLDLLEATGWRVHRAPQP